MFQEYLKKVCEAGGGVSSRINIAAAHGILKTLDNRRLKEFGGYIDLNRHWAQSLLRFVQRRATTSKSKQSVEDFTFIKENFLDLVATVEMEEIPPQLIFNWDQNLYHQHHGQ